MKAEPLALAARLWTSVQPHNNIQPACLHNEQNKQNF